MSFKPLKQQIKRIVRIVLFSSPSWDPLKDLEIYTKTEKPDMVSQACNTSTLEVEAQRSEV